MSTSGRTLYLRVTNIKTGVSRIESREAWDADKFLASITKQYADDEENPSVVSIAERAEYLKQVKRR